MNVEVAAGCAVAAGVVGWFVPLVVRGLPEPSPEPAPEPEEQAADGDESAGSGAEEPPARRPRKPIPDFSLWGMHAVEREKELYRDLADLRGLALACALASAVVAGLLGWKLGWHPALAVVVPTVPACVAITVVDWRTRYIPTRLVLPATAYAVLAGLVLWPAADARADLVLGLVGLAVVRSFFWILWFIRAAGMGFGDVRLGALLGFVLGYLGPGELFFGTWIGFIVFSLPGVLIALIKRDYRLMRVPFPFGPFMLIGALVGVFLGQPLIDAAWG
jgi:leader peptidase (prepilin peptidase) / N-methyltransferase